MKTYHALATLLTLRQLDSVDKPTVARVTRELLDLFGPIPNYSAGEGRQGGYAINYDGSTKPNRKVSIEFYAPPLGDHQLCFTEQDGLLHGYIDVIPDLVNGFSYRIVGSGSRELNKIADTQARKVLNLDISEELAATLADMAPEAVA